MYSKSKGFIAKPVIWKLSNHGLDYKDILTYITLRSYNNSDSENCFPSFETMSKRSGFGKTFLIKSIKRLEKSGLIDVYRPNRYKASNKYFFPRFDNQDRYERIPYQIFDEELTPYEKAMLLNLRQFFREGIYFGNIKSMADGLQLTYKTVYTQLRSLIEKGYISVTPGNDLFYRYKLTDKIDWSFDDHKVDTSDYADFKIKVA